MSSEAAMSNKTAMSNGTAMIKNATPEAPDRFRLLATFLAGRSLGVAMATTGQPSYTDGRCVFVSPELPVTQQRQQVILQAMLLGSGSFDQKLVRALRGRTHLAKRYLMLEGCRVLSNLSGVVSEISLPQIPVTNSPEESLTIAKGKTSLAAAPNWFGVIKPSQLLTAQADLDAKQLDENELTFELVQDEVQEEEEDQEDFGKSKLLGLLDNPLMNSKNALKFLAKILGTSSSTGDGGGDGEMPVNTIRKVNKVSANAKPLPQRIHFVNEDAPGAVVGVGGARYPEWDVFNSSYRANHCRVMDFPMTETMDVATATVAHDEVLRKRLSRLGLGPKICRRQPDGDDLDIEALIDLGVDIQSGHSPSENIYVARRKLSRDLGVLILLDASGSVSENDPDGLCVHEHQRRAAATIAITLEELGDRVALYACRSHGREAVHLLGLKPFSQRFGAGARARLNMLEPDGFTRLGAAIRHAGEILKGDAGTPNRLLLVLSDGVPYDHGYEGRYAEADAHKALEELRSDGVACLCLSVGASTASDALERVFGSACQANAPVLSDLSPRMDELFLTALKDLSAPNPRAVRK
ncbi:MAG: VWA domain-containing protein [Pseudomonadales bacterium]|nr:VWA domain-containing protein [Pseudomonadales bacterium]